MNIIDTFDDKVTKDLIGDGTITATIKLSDQELTQIYYELRKIGVMKYPDTYNPGSFSFDLKTFSFVSYMVMPYLTYDLTIRYGDESKRIFWEDKNMANSGNARRLRGLIEDIRKIVESKDEYKKLPAFKGSYS